MFVTVHSSHPDEDHFKWLKYRWNSIILVVASIVVTYIYICIMGRMSFIERSINVIEEHKL